MYPRTRCFCEALALVTMNLDICVVTYLGAAVDHPLPLVKSVTADQVT